MQNCRKGGAHASCFYTGDNLSKSCWMTLSFLYLLLCAFYHPPLIILLITTLYQTFTFAHSAHKAAILHSVLLIISFKPLPASAQVLIAKSSFVYLTKLKKRVGKRNITWCAQCNFRQSSRVQCILGMTSPEARIDE